MAPDETSSSATLPLLRHQAQASIDFWRGRSGREQAAWDCQRGVIPRRRLAVVGPAEGGDPTGIGIVSEPRPETPKLGTGGIVPVGGHSSHPAAVAYEWRPTRYRRAANPMA